MRPASPAPAKIPAGGGQRKGKAPQGLPAGRKDQYKNQSRAWLSGAQSAMAATAARVIWA